MERRTFYATALLLALFVILLGGCNSAIMMGDRVVGIREGKFFYTDGTLKADYRVSFEQAWKASETALEGMNATILETQKRVSSGTYTAHLDGEDVRIAIEYLEPEVTMVSVRVGLTGNNLASKLIHDRIRESF